MSLLKQFQNDDRAAITQKFRDLCNSVAGAFEGRNDRYNDAERFEYVLNGLVSVYIRLNAKEGTIETSISADLGLSYGESDTVEIRDKDGRKTGVDAKKLKALVAKKVKLASKWEIGLQQYSRISMKQTVTDLDNDFLSDLVKIMEKSGYIPRVEARQRYF